jgi:hypothetical protein
MFAALAKDFFLAESADLGDLFVVKIGKVVTE